MIFKDKAEYKDNDSELAKYTISNLHEEIERLKSIICEVRYKLLIITSRVNITGDLFDELLDLAHLLGDDKE